MNVHMQYSAEIGLLSVETFTASGGFASDHTIRGNASGPRSELSPRPNFHPSEGSNLHKAKSWQRTYMVNNQTSGLRDMQPPICR
jgi:hypothetical protein